MNLDVKIIKKLREETGAGVLDTKQALAKCDNDYEKAKEMLFKQGLAKADKKAEREIKDGLVYSYIHNGGKIGSLVVVGCETDFVAKTQDFKDLCHEIALQVTTGDYENVQQVLEDTYIKDDSKTIAELIKEKIAVIGENITLLDFAKLSI